MKRNISSKWTLPGKIFNFPAAGFPVVGLIAAYHELASDILPIFARHCMNCNLPKWAENDNPKQT
jgi:hypothetical protein